MLELSLHFTLHAFHYDQFDLQQKMLFVPHQARAHATTCIRTLHANNMLEMLFLFFLFSM